MLELPTSGFLVEAEEFDHFGGWILDSQFEMQMGSPYLLAHGNGVPVADASTTIEVADSGQYYIWVRAKDWVPGYHPGRFTLKVNDTELDTVFGTNDRDWLWQYAGRVDLPKGNTKLVLHDLTGFCGRCDAIFFSHESIPPPEAVNHTSHAWRRRFRGLPSQPVDGGHFDVVVVGGGVPGCTAALTSARLGQRVALVQDRPYLGGNASLEIGLSPRGLTAPLVEEVADRTTNGDLHARQLLEAEPTATLFLEHTVYNAVTENSKIISIDARDARSGRELRISAPIFIDCSGKAIFGEHSGAETLFGQESKVEYGEALAPIKGNNMHHGNTVFFRTRFADSPVPFPSVPWATEVAKDYSNLDGQLIKPGFENGPGPSVPSSIDNDPSIRRRMKLPNTHYWEYGQWLDPYTHAEDIRDHLLRAIYGTFSNVKTRDPQKYANLAFDHVAYVAAQGEFKRYKGDYVLCETDIRTHRQFPDAVVQNGGAFCLHYPGNERYDFRLKDWKWDERDGKPYDIPFRCFYSKNIDNLMMAGKHISVTHVAGSNTKFMGNGGLHALATAAAAFLCRKYNKTPRRVGEQHLDELKSLTEKIVDDGLQTSFRTAGRMAKI